MYTQIPLEIVVNPLTKIFLSQHEESIREKLHKTEVVDMNSNLSKNVHRVEDNLDELNQIIISQHDTKKGVAVQKNSDWVDFMGIILKGLNHTQRVDF